MTFNNLFLSNFKNFESLELEFDGKINCLVGKNGVGKTNILDALHYLSMTRSSVNPVDSSNIRFGESIFIIRSEVAKNEQSFQVICAIESGKKKTIKVNRKEHEKLSDHIGLFPIVIISPNDISLIYDGNEVRRKFFDGAISQQDKLYLQQLVRYNKALRQRNALLKKFSETMRIEEDLLAPYDHEILKLGAEIYNRRKTYMSDYLPHFNNIYSTLSKSSEGVGVRYESTWQHENPEEIYKNAIKKDLIYQRTTISSSNETSTLHEKESYFDMLRRRPVTC